MLFNNKLIGNTIFVSINKFPSHTRIYSFVVRLWDFVSFGECAGFDLKFFAKTIDSKCDFVSMYMKCL